MNLDEALDILDGGKMKIYETPFGTKLSVKTPTGADWHASGEELEAAKEVMGQYEDVAAAVYEAESEDEVQRALNDADVDGAPKVIGKVENIPLTANECRRLAD